VKHAKSEAKKGNYLMFHSLSKEFKTLASPEEKRELLNATLNKLRQEATNAQVYVVCFLTNLFRAQVLLLLPLPLPSFPQLLLSGGNGVKGVASNQIGLPETNWVVRKENKTDRCLN
jgi:hypothetical protein